jgi:hypothetical protein
MAGAATWNTYPIALFPIPVRFGPQGFDGRKYPHTISNFGDTQLLEDAMIAFQQCFSIDVVV